MAQLEIMAQPEKLTKPVIPTLYEVCKKALSEIMHEARKNPSGFNVEQRVNDALAPVNQELERILLQKPDQVYRWEIQPVLERIMEALCIVDGAAGISQAFKHLRSIIAKNPIHILTMVVWTPELGSRPFHSALSWENSPAVQLILHRELFVPSKIACVMFGGDIGEYQGVAEDFLGIGVTKAKAAAACLTNKAQKEELEMLADFVANPSVSIKDPRLLELASKYAPEFKPPAAAP